MAPLPCTWSSVTKHQPKFGTERDRKGPFLLSTMCWLTTVIYYIIYWLCHHFSLVEPYNFILFKTRRSQSPTFGLDFGSYDLDFATRNRYRFSGCFSNHLDGKTMESPVPGSLSALLRVTSSAEKPSEPEKRSRSPRRCEGKT